MSIGSFETLELWALQHTLTLFLIDSVPHVTRVSVVWAHLHKACASQVNEGPICGLLRAAKRVDDLVSAEPLAFVGLQNNSTACVTLPSRITPGGCGLKRSVFGLGFAVTNDCNPQLEKMLIGFFSVVLTGHAYPLCGFFALGVVGTGPVQLVKLVSAPS